MKDALGNPLIIGKVYGFSRNSNGLTTIKTGKLVKINMHMVSLEVIESKRALWHREAYEQRSSSKVSVLPSGLFRVYEFNLGDMVTCEEGYNHGEIFTVTGIKEAEIELSGDWSGGTHNVYQSSWVKTETCKHYKNKEK